MKIAIVILVIVVFAFVYALARPAPKVTPDWLKPLGARLRVPFDFREVSRDCFEEKNTTFRIPHACLIRISSSKTKFRLLALQVKEGIAATIDFQPAPGDDSGLSFDPRKLTNGEDAETLTIPAVGGNLTITCMPINTSCSVHAD